MESCSREVLVQLLCTLIACTVSLLLRLLGALSVHVQSYCFGLEPKWHWSLWNSKSALPTRACLHSISGVLQLYIIWGSTLRLTASTNGNGNSPDIATNVPITPSMVPIKKITWGNDESCWRREERERERGREREAETEAKRERDVYIFFIYRERKRQRERERENQQRKRCLCHQNPH